MSQPKANGVSLRMLLEGIVEAPELALFDMTSDSRRVSEGALFVARTGGATHGINYVEAAIAQGAVAVLCDLADDDVRVQNARRQLPVICLPQLQRHLGDIAARFFAHPTTHMHLTAVTGTNGKSSICWLLAGAMRELGSDAGVMGTLGFGRPRALAEQALTTPDVIDVQRYAAAMLSEGIDALALEASSHAIEQGRLDGSQIDIAVFSNLSRDHLDYHADMDAYFEAKAQLFADEQLSARIISVDDEYGLTLWQRFADSDAYLVASSAPSVAATRFIFAKDTLISESGITLSIATHLGECELRSSLVGRFNVQNLLLALAALVARGVELAVACQALGAVEPVPGRMQRVSQSTPVVLVDYAHTPAALQAALAAMREHCRGDLWCVFGCGGERDQGKRAQMAACAEQDADHVVITSDNSRGESFEDIAKQIMLGIARPDAVHVQERRDRAIEFAINAAADDDWVLIAGKGHELTQTSASGAIAFDDRAQARLALAAREEVSS